MKKTKRSQKLRPRSGDDNKTTFRLAFSKVLPLLWFLLFPKLLRERLHFIEEYITAKDAEDAKERLEGTFFDRPMISLRSKFTDLVLLFLLILLFLPGGCSRPDSGYRPEAVSTGQELSPQAMLDIWKKAASPGLPHEKIAPLVGSWNTEIRLWAVDGKPPSISRGTATQEWILGGRFIREEFSGEMADMPYQGIGFLGFDNITQRFVSAWLDTFGTGIFSSTGNFDDVKHELTLVGGFKDPVTGALKSSRAITRILDNDHHLVEMYEESGAGQERKSLQIDYTRKVSVHEVSEKIQ